MMQNHRAFELDPDDEPLPLAPDEDLDPGDTGSDETAAFALAEPAADDAQDRQEAPAADGPHDALRWALDSMSHPAMSAADWLASDIDSSHPSATELLTSPAITLAQARQAKTVYKTMRIVGETAADRRVGARMYAAAIAAALVRFGARISTQSDAALKRGFQGLLDDRSMPAPLRDLGGRALVMLADLQAQELMQRSQPRRNRSA